MPRKFGIKRSLAATSFAALTFVIAGCITNGVPTTANYLMAPSPVRLASPVYLSIVDQRHAIERHGDPSGFYNYTVDGVDPNHAAQSLGIDICQVMERKRITVRARVGLPGEVPPTDGVLVRLSLLSWYGRLPSSSTITEKALGALLARPIYAEGRCRFAATITYAGESRDLGVADASATFQVSRNATLAKDGNLASAASADKAIAQFLQAFEKQFAK